MRMQRMEAIGTLAAGIAHNFNNLLMGILGNASLASLEIEEDHHIQRNLENIKTLVDSGSRLTRQILDYSKGGAHEIEPLMLGRIIEKTLDTIDKTRKDVRIHQDIAKELCAADGDKGQIEQVLMNLFVNALEAMPGGGDLFIEAKNVSHLELADKHFKSRSGDYLRIVIRDTGIGMDNEIKEHIFEPFFTTKGLVKGTGLGLASAYGIIKAHGGYIDVESKKGLGSSFIIYLPASSKKIIPPITEEYDIVFGNETILLVDDEDIILETSEHLLRYLGYVVIKAKSGREAIDIYGLKKDQIDLVILDLIMSDIGGAEVLDRMIEIKKDIKVILSSGYSVDDQVQDVVDRGCKGFIQKPFDIKELSFTIRKVLA
jgi:two-component system, cell cycle sensor histidine kinase and response regulator CckA